MSRSRARKNRFKYKTLRQIGFFKIFVMNYPDHNGRVYPGLNFGSIKFSKEVIREIQHPQGGVFSISSQIDENNCNNWNEGHKQVEEAIKSGKQFYPTIEPQAIPHIERHLDVMCAVLGVSRDNLEINSPVCFASTIKGLVDYAVKLGQPITEPQEPSNVDFLSPWPNRLNFAGVWSNPVDVSNFQGPSFEEVRVEDLIQKVQHTRRENTRQRIIEVAESFGEAIEVDPFLLRDDLKVFRHRNDVYDLIPIEYDSREWAIVMVALHRRPEILDPLKTKGYNFIHIQRISATETTIDTYQIIDTANDRDVEAFKPFRVEHSVDFTAAEIIGDDINKFAEKKLKEGRLTTLKLDWD